MTEEKERCEEDVPTEEIEKHLNLSVEEEHPIMTTRRQSLNKASRRLSLFDFKVEDSITNERRSKYEELLPKEAEEWVSLLDRKRQEVVGMMNTVVEIDENILSEELRVYFNNSINFEKFLEGSEEFCGKANVYLHDYSDLIEMYDNLTTSFDKLVQNRSYNVMEKFVL